MNKLRLILITIILFSISLQVRPSTYLLPRSAISPPKINNKPVEVDLNLHIDEILNIKEGNNTYRVKCFETIGWEDKRLSFDSTKAGTAVKVYLEQDAKDELNKIWWPDIQFDNAEGSGKQEHEELFISKNGHVEYHVWSDVTLATDFNMLRFPFDTQHLIMKLKSFAWDSNSISINKDKSNVYFSKEFSLPGWSIIGLNKTVSNHREPHDRASFNELNVQIVTRRDPGFFVWKFLFPLTVVMVLIAGVLWIPAEQIKDRVGATLTGMLTAAAYGFTISHFLPDNIYDTYMDTIFVVSLLYAAILMIVNVYCYQLHIHNSKERALRIEKISKVAFPVGFLLVIVLLKVIYSYI